MSALLVWFLSSPFLPFGEKLFCVKVIRFVLSLEYNSYGIFLPNSQIYISWVSFQDLKSVMPVGSMLEGSSKCMVMKNLVQSSLKGASLN